MDIFDYLKEERRTFAKKKFSVLDSIVLSKLAYLNYDKIIPKEGIKLKDIFKLEYFDDLLNVLVLKEKYEQLLISAVLNPRYRDITLKHFVSDSSLKEVKQFSAITYIIDDKAVVAYRGTDSTIVGWKENFNMTYEYPIPSQAEALKYLEDVYSKEKKKIIIVGHSKGGNLGTYAGINASDKTKKDILKIYSLDGPGFPEEVFTSKEYLKSKNKIVKILPKESIVGIYLEDGEYLVVKSNVNGIMQHEPMFWDIKDSDLVYYKHLAPSSISFGKIMRKWINSATKEERELFVDTLFTLVDANDKVNLFSKLKIIQKTPQYIHRYNALEPERKEFMAKVFKNLFNIIIDSEIKDNKMLKLGSKKKDINNK